jgi:hypothetical protein
MAGTSRRGTSLTCICAHGRTEPWSTRLKRENRRRNRPACQITISRLPSHASKFVRHRLFAVRDGGSAVPLVLESPLIPANLDGGIPLDMGIKRSNNEPSVQIRWREDRRPQRSLP